MDALITFNVLVLAGLAVFFAWEERRHRRFSRTIAETKADLITIVHQLRTPLSNLRKYNEFLQNEELGDISLAQQVVLGNVRITLAESFILLDRLLARSRLDDGKVGMQPASLNVRDVVQGTLAAVMPITMNKHQKVTLKGTGTIRIFTDPLLLHGILDELLFNAAHYTPDGGRISVTLREKEKFVDIEVSDTGIGISKAERPHMFEKFFRGERATSMVAGHGLGLSFAKQFAATLGGSIQFRSAKGKGSTFTLSLRKKRK